MLFSWAAWRPPLLEGADRKRDVLDLFGCITCVLDCFSFSSSLLPLCSRGCLVSAFSLG